MLDCKIMNAQVIDGSGKPAFRADVGLREGRIAALGDLRETRAGEVIDARGRCLTPGFLDIHRHADLAYSCSAARVSSPLTSSNMLLLA